MYIISATGLIPVMAAPAAAPTIAASEIAVSLTRSSPNSVRAYILSHNKYPPVPFHFLIQSFLQSLPIRYLSHFFLPCAFLPPPHLNPLPPGEREG